MRTRYINQTLNNSDDIFISLKIRDCVPFVWRFSWDSIAVVDVHKTSFFIYLERKGTKQGNVYFVVNTNLILSLYFDFKDKIKGPVKDPDSSYVAMEHVSEKNWLYLKEIHNI